MPPRYNGMAIGDARRAMPPARFPRDGGRDHDAAVSVRIGDRTWGGPGGDTGFGGDRRVLVAGRGGAGPAAADGRRRRGPADGRADHGRADRDDAGPRGGHDPGPGRGLPQGEALRGGRRRQGGPAPVRHRRGAVQGQARRGQGEARRRPRRRWRRRKQSKAREVAAAQLALDQAQLLAGQGRGAARQQNLFGRNAASQEDVDQAEAERKKGAAQVEADTANLEQARADYETNILLGPGRRRRGQGQPSATPRSTWATAGCRPDRRPDRRGQGQGRQPRRPGAWPRADTPSWPRSSSSTRWASTSRSARATSTGPRG